MSITKPVFVRFDNIQRPQPPKLVDFNIQPVQRVQFVDFNSPQPAFPQPPARRKKSDLPKIKRRLKP